jgi:hypothetical protein
MTTASAIHNKQFDALVRETLPVVDEALQRAEIPVSHRPWRAALLIARHCLSLEDADGRVIDTADPGFLLHPLFGPIFWTASRWYERRYGASTQAQPVSLHGLILFRGTFLRLRVPTTTSLRSPDNRVMKVQFPLDMRAEERPMRLLEPSPIPSRLKRSERGQLEAQCLDLGGRLRRIWHLTVPLEGAEPSMRELKSSFLDHLDGCATRITDPNPPDRVGLAMMDLRLCCELTVKMHLLQEKTEFERTHDFRILLPHCSDEVRALVKTRLPRPLWRYGKVNAMRYGSRHSTRSEEYAKLYTGTLGFLEHLLGLLKRRSTFGGMEATLRAPVWAAMGPEDFVWRAPIGDDEEDSAAG